MKLTALILVITCMQVTAHGVAQDRITFSGEDVSLQKVFSVIKKQTSYLFLYNDALLENARKVTLHVKSASIEEVLNACFKDQPLKYTIRGKTIFIINKPVPEKKRNQALVGIKGRVINSQGEPLAGANIIVKRTGRGTITDVNGNFSLSDVASEDLITISYVGYQAQSVKVRGMTNFTLVLALANDELDKMVIQAYGTTTRRLATGNIAKVTAEEIQRQPVMNPLLALQGKVAGLDVTQVNGYPSAPIKIELRGRSAINPIYPSDPLYIIDGVPLTILNITNQTSNYYVSGSPGFIQSGMNGPAGGQSPFFSINPSDIESIEVLKDADATSIYGSRGANGVILITTKKGIAGKTQFNLNITEGITRVTRYYDLMNTQQYLAMRREALKNDGIPPSLNNGDYDLVQWDTSRYTNWQKELYGGIGKQINVQGDVSGGNAQTNFRIGVGYNKTTNILTVSGADQRASLSFSLSHSTVNKKFNISLSAGYSYTQSDMVSLNGNSLTLPPNAPAIFDSAGNLNFADWGDYNSPARGAFQFQGIKQPYVSKTNFLNSGLNLSYQPVKGLTIGTSFGISTALANQENYLTMASQDPLSNPTGTAQYGSNSNKNWIIEPQISYSSRIGLGKMDVQLGGSWQKAVTEASFTTGNGYTNDIFIKNLSSALSQTALNNYGEYNYAAVFGRLTYNFQNKYILNLSARRDGSSRFGEDNLFGNFGSAGAAWIFTQEKWLASHFGFLSFGKLRGSYGTTGSDGIGDYAFLSRWSSGGTQPYNGISALDPIQHVNPYFQWQVSKKLEGGIDLGFLKDRILLGVAYYRNRCGNQLINFPLPAYTGFNTVVANSPALVQNDGWEFTINAKVVDTKRFSWSVNFNTGINHNKLVVYPNFEMSPYTDIYVIGQPLNITRILHYTGVDPLTGNYSFEDKDHDGQIRRSSGIIPYDIYIKNLSPKFLGGLGMNFSYNGINLSLFLTMKKQLGRNALYSVATNAGSIGNQPTDLIGKEWQKPGDIAEISKFTTQYSTSNIIYQNTSDGVYTDASFIRLSNLSLSYSLPGQWIKKTGMKGCNIFFNTNNIFIITNYKGPDPETQNFGGLPPAKTLAGGLSFNF